MAKTKKPTLETFTIRLKAETVLALEQIAKEQKLTVSAAVREIVETALLERDKRAENRADLYALLRQAEASIIRRIELRIGSISVPDYAQKLQQIESKIDAAKIAAGEAREAAIEAAETATRNAKSPVSGEPKRGWFR